MISSKIYKIILTLTVFLLGSCVDDRLFTPDGPLPEGETVVTLDASFNPFSESNLTRSGVENDGKILDNISNLWIVVYDEDGNLIDSPYCITKIDLKDATIRENNGLGGVGDIKFKVPFGKCYIIAVANLKNSVALSKTTIPTLDDLLRLRMTWDDTNISNNAEMLGYFRESASAATEPNPENVFEPVIINRPGMKLKAWLRRCASKITIDIDGSGLRENVEVYLKEARIYDIAYDCSLGYGPGLSKEDESAENSTNDGSNELGSSLENTIPAKYRFNNTPSKPDNDTYGLIKDSKQVISYVGNDTQEDYKSWPKVDRNTPFQVEDITDFHTGESNALYFYENMQYYNGDPKDTPKQMVLDFETGGVNRKDGMPFGSYIEVEGFYVSKAIGNVTQGIVKYRFMLGKDVLRSFEAERNFHYKLTLVLKGNGNEASWQIDYNEQILEVESPKVVNYQGRFLTPNSDPNLGHTFNNENVIEIRSYRDYYGLDEKGEVTKFQEPVAYEVSYKEGDHIEDATEEGYTDGYPDFLIESHEETYKEQSGLIKSITLKIRPQTATPININKNLTNAGTQEKTYNLAHSAGTTGTIQNTANCYMVDRKGTYTLPLVYGNAITNGSTYYKSFKTEATGTFALPTLKNHLNNDISSPYILQNDGCEVRGTNGAALLWEDVSGLITNVSYKENIYGNFGVVKGENEVITNPGSPIGGIQFTVSQAAEGNAVIAIYDNQDRIMWSWHIWVTNFSGLEEFSKEKGELITVTKNTPVQSWPAPPEFDFMPVNLGWCSEGEDIKFYPERTYTLKFTAGKLSRKILVKQKSHMAFPRGNNTYYQWGRKDPFWGSAKIGTSADDGGNKKIYTSDNSSGVEKNPDQFFGATGRKTTIELFNGTNTGKSETQDPNDKFVYANNNRLIQQPDKWHNPPRIKPQDHSEWPTNGTPISLNKFDSRNEIYYNLWGQQNADAWDYSTHKTVYDPCPVGYMVPHYNAFSCFTTSGKSLDDTGGEINGEYQSKNWYDAVKSNISWGQSGYSTYTDNLLELYTDLDKLQSIIFPESGYRDWDNYAIVTKLGYNNQGNGYAWSKEIIATKYTDWFVTVDAKKGIIYLPPDAAFNFEFSRYSKLVRPNNEFNTCDGMPVRPLFIPKDDPNSPFYVKSEN